MARSKLRKSNSALSRGQMVRIENRFTLRLEEDTYDPDAIGTCCTANADGEKCVCADNVTARECCEQKGDFKEGESCSNDPCPCNITGACCVPCDTDADVLGLCISGVTSGRCDAEGGFFQPGVDCGENTCEPCNDNTVYEAKVACCEQCPNGTNTGRNGNCVTKSATGFSIPEALQAARDQCAGVLGQESTGKAGSVEDPCASGNGGCPDCSLKTRPFCTFCTALSDTTCDTTRSGECAEVEVDNQGNIVINNTGLDGVIFNPGDVGTDIFCSDLEIPNGPYSNQNCGNFGNAEDCVTCQDVCCCQDGTANPVPGTECAGEVLKDVALPDCQDLICNEEFFYCKECGTSSCSPDGVQVNGGAGSPCSATVNIETTCRVIAQNVPCGVGQVDAVKGDLGDNVDCGTGSDNPCPPCAGFGGCNFAAIFNTLSPLCGPTQVCATCTTCPFTVIIRDAAGNNCGEESCCRVDVGQFGPCQPTLP